MGRSVNQRIASLKKCLESRIMNTAEGHPHKVCWEGRWDTPPPSTPGSCKKLCKAPKPPPETGEECPCNDPLYIFFAAAVPQVPTGEYMRRLIKYMEFGDDDVLFAVAFYYLDRAAQRYRERKGAELVTPFSAYRTFFTCCVLAAKFGQEKPFKNKFYKEVGGLPNCTVMLKLEVQMLLLLDYELFMHGDMFKGVYVKCFEAEPPTPMSAVKRAPPIGLEFKKRESISNGRRNSASLSPLPSFPDSPLPIHSVSPASWDGESCGESPVPRVPSKMTIACSCDDVLCFLTAQPSE